MGALSWRLQRLGWVAGYYLATPAFAVADLGFGVPVRLAQVVPQGGRLVYYAAVFALGFLCVARPRTAPWVGMLESATNLLILLLGILLPIWSLSDAVLSGAPMVAGLTPAGAFNALLSGTALTVSFRRNQATALGHAGLPRLPDGL